MNQSEKLQLHSRKQQLLGKIDGRTNVDEDHSAERMTGGNNGLIFKQSHQAQMNHSAILLQNPLSQTDLDDAAGDRRETAEMFTTKIMVRGVSQQHKNKNEERPANLLNFQQFQQQKHLTTHIDIISSSALTSQFLPVGGGGFVLGSPTGGKAFENGIKKEVMLPSATSAVAPLNVINSGSESCAQNGDVQTYINYLFNQHTNKIEGSAENQASLVKHDNTEQVNQAESNQAAQDQPCDKSPFTQGPNASPQFNEAQIVYDGCGEQTGTFARCIQNEGQLANDEQHNLPLELPSLLLQNASTIKGGMDEGENGQEEEKTGENLIHIAALVPHLTSLGRVVQQQQQIVILSAPNANHALDESLKINCDSQWGYQCNNNDDANNLLEPPQKQIAQISNNSNCQGFALPYNKEAQLDNKLQINIMVDKTDLAAVTLLPPPQSNTSLGNNPASRSPANQIIRVDSNIEKSALQNDGEEDDQIVVVAAGMTLKSRKGSEEVALIQSMGFQLALPNEINCAQDKVRHDTQPPVTDTQQIMQQLELNHPGLSEPKGKLFLDAQMSVELGATPQDTQIALNQHPLASGGDDQIMLGGGIMSADQNATHFEGALVGSQNGAHSEQNYVLQENVKSHDVQQINEEEEEKVQQELIKTESQVQQLEIQKEISNQSVPIIQPASLAEEVKEEGCGGDSNLIITQTGIPLTAVNPMITPQAQREEEEEDKLEPDFDEATEYCQGAISQRIREERPCTILSNDMFENAPSVVYGMNGNFCIPSVDNQCGGGGVVIERSLISPIQQKIVEEGRHNGSHGSVLMDESNSVSAPSGEQQAIRQENNEAVILHSQVGIISGCQDVCVDKSEGLSKLQKDPSAQEVEVDIGYQEQPVVSNSVPKLADFNFRPDIPAEENKNQDPLEEEKKEQSPIKQSAENKQAVKKSSSQRAQLQIIEPENSKVAEDGQQVNRPPSINQIVLPDPGLLAPPQPAILPISQIQEASPARSRSRSQSSDANLSELSSPRSIPDEHKISEYGDIVDGDQYISNYSCIMKGITWARDSHGLFDYETRHPLKKQMRTEMSQLLVRTSKNNELHIISPNQDYKQVFENQGQLLLTINKVRNHYYLEAPKMPKNDDLLPQYQSDDQPPAGQNQENQQIPSDVTERMFLVVRSLKEGDKKLDYKLRKNDIIKLGRVKFKVKEIRIKAIEEEKEKKRHKREKYLKKLHEEEQKKQLNEASKPAQVTQSNLGARAHSANARQEHPSQPQHIKMNPQMIRSSSSRFLDALEGEESFVEVECVLPVDQQRNQEQWKSHRMRQKRNEAKKKGGLTERLEPATPQQAVKAEDATNFDVPIHNNRGGNHLRIINNTTSQNAADPNQPLFFNEDSKQQPDEDVKQEEHYSMNEGPLHTHNNNADSRNADAQSQLMVPEPNRNKSQNFILQNHQSVKKHISTQQNQLFLGGGNVTNNAMTNRGNGMNDDEQQVTKMDANEQREVTDIACKPQEEEEDLEMGENIDQESLNKELPFCRFCWVNDTSEENPLLSSCKCRGGVQYVHFQCLKEWVKTKRSAKEHSHISSYQFKQFECEICKTPYPYVFKAAGKRYKLIDIPFLNPRPGQGGNNIRPSGDYLVLESLTLEKNTSRIVHIITPTANTRSVRLGRGHDSDLRINDISVSRQHAVIRFKNDGFFLQDNMSKFGTLVLVRKRLPLHVSLTQAVQVGRTVVNFQIKPMPLPNFEVGKFIKSNRVLSEKDKQNEELRKVLVTMQQAEDYIQKQQAEHQRLARTDNFHQRNDYQRRIQQNIHEEEIKIDPSVEALQMAAAVGEGARDSLQLNVNRILELNNQRRQELLNYMQNNHGGAINGINGLLQEGQPGAVVPNNQAAGPHGQVQAAAQQNQPQINDADIQSLAPVASEELPNMTHIVQHEQNNNIAVVVAIQAAQDTQQNNLRMPRDIAEPNQGDAEPAHDSV